MAEEGGYPEMLDVQFALQGDAVPYDYLDALWSAVRTELPWLEADANAALHPLYGLSPGNGVWYLSRRSRLSLRVPRAQVAAAQQLAGRRLRLGANEVTTEFVGERELMPSSVIYAKFVTFGVEADGAEIQEDVFFAHCQRAFAGMGIAPQAICGKAQRAMTEAGLLSGFSLMLTGISQEANLQLQQQGLGAERKRGCGVFVPHKSMAAAGTLE